MKHFILTGFSLLLCLSCTFSQDKNEPRLIGGPCEGCEAVFEYGNKSLASVDTLPGFKNNGQKINIRGTIYKADGMTPAQNVILYVYHTDTEGYYTPSEDAKGWERRHGSSRGWVKTDENGFYSYYTIQPGSYPNQSNPAHIHYTILEPNGNYYWTGGIMFKGDTRLTPELSKGPFRGGGSDVITLKKDGDLLIGVRDIVLGKNITGYK